MLTHCSGEGRKKRKREGMCGGTHTTSMFCLERKEKSYDSLLRVTLILDAVGYETPITAVGVIWVS